MHSLDRTAMTPKIEGRQDTRTLCINVFRVNFGGQGSRWNPMHHQSNCKVPVSLSPEGDKIILYTNLVAYRPKSDSHDAWGFRLSGVHRTHRSAYSSSTDT